MAPVRLLRILVYAGIWVVVSGAVACVIFVGSERSIDLASHRATVSPDFSGDLLLRSGPVLPDLRAPTDSRIGLEIELGKSDTESLEELTSRYAAIAAQPDGQIAVVERAVRGMALAAIVQGGAIGALPLLMWAALGRERRSALLHGVPTRKGAVGVVALAVVVAGVTVPLTWGKQQAESEHWIPLQAFVGASVVLPAELKDVVIMGDASTAQTRKLIASAVSSYQQGLTFYSEAADDAEFLDLRKPEDDETVVLVVSDRHDNVGMDKVARAIGDAGGATAVFDAGDDTSTGERWEAFSLDSVSATFDDFDDRWAVAGNHDNGSFVRSHMTDLGWTYFDGAAVDGPGGSRLLGADDPRASGLGNWRDETGLTSAEVAQRLTDAACDADKAGERINTLLVHDADFGDDALAAGCVDLVIGGHTHVQDGPTPVVVTDGNTGYSYTVGTTGGAAYAIAIGSKLRRAAGVALVTYRKGRPVGIQSVTLETNGRYTVDDWVVLTY